VYDPEELDTRLTVPLTEFITPPAGAIEYVPPAEPEKVTVATPVLEQKGFPAYEIDAEGDAVIVMLAEAELVDAQVPL